MSATHHAALPDCPSKLSGWNLTILIGIVILGLSARLYFFALDRHLWNDEAAVACNVVERSTAELLSQPLDCKQHAPPLFLLFEKWSYQLRDVLGIERALRLQPLVLSCLGLILFCWLMAREFSAAIAAVACLLFALSPALISFSADAKQYAGEVTACIVILERLTALVRRGSVTPWDAVGLAVGGSVLLLWSFTATFVLAVAGSSLMVVLWARRDRRSVLLVALAAAVWLATFAGYMATVGRHSLANKELTKYWEVEGGFIHLPPRSVEDMTLTFYRLLGLIESPIGLRGWQVAGMFFVLGIAALRVSHRLWLVVAGGIFAALTIASAAHVYPLGTRLVLFTAPVSIPVLAAGVWGSLSMLRAGLPVRVAMLVLLVVPQGMALMKEARAPYRTGLKQTLAMVAERSQPDQTLYLFGMITIPYRFYNHEIGYPDRRIVRGRDPHPAYAVDGMKYADYCAAQVATLHGPVWLVISDASPDEREMLLRIFKARGYSLDEVQHGQSYAYLFDLK